MKLNLKGWLLLALPLFMPLAMTQSIRQEGVLHGSVRSQNGEPLAGVTVRSDCGDTKTDEQGRYSIQPSRNPCRARIVQFRAEGFSTLTKAVQENTGEIDGMLRPGVSAWIPPTWDPADSIRVGGKMKFLIPKSAKIKYGPPSDAWHIGIGYGSRSKREWMGINGGGNYSSGLPYAVILHPTEIIERDMTCGPNGYDIRGQTKDGKRWRDAGMGLRGFGESIGYSNASEKAAEFFDSIIDGLQCDQEGAPGFGRIPKKQNK
jgi:hypothetical protein